MNKFINNFKRKLPEYLDILLVLIALYEGIIKSNLVNASLLLIFVSISLMHKKLDSLMKEVNHESKKNETR